MCADKARDFLGKGHPGGEQEGKGTQENYSATWLAVSGFTVMVFASMLSLAHQSDSESFLVVHVLFNQDGCQRQGSISGRLLDMWCLLLTFQLVDSY